jgi:hypothetical protein
LGVIIDSRLREQFPFSSRQKGSVHEPGCFNNVNILTEILRDAKTKKGITIVQLDNSKAFDTVHHEAIDPTLRRQEIRASVTTSYDRVTTDITHKGTTTKVALKRGVKQGIN